MKLNNADLSFSDAGVPISAQFDDVYYSKDDGEAESAYVFFDGNDMAKRWLEYQRPCFYLAETGFGTGLNLALTCARFLRFREEHPNHPLKKLHLISFELFPLEKQQMQQIAKQWPQYAPFYDALLEQYPYALAGTYRLIIDKKAISFDLVLGDIQATIQQVVRPQHGIDAWYLDGFAPSKNQGMWHQQVFAHMQGLSAINSSFATFTSAGFVKRGLQAHGFEVNKIKGFGRKREMLIGRLTEESKKNHKHALEYLRTPAKDCQHIAIIGGGIAGLLLSHFLLSRGIKVSLYCKGDAGDGASGNLIGGFYPQLQADYSLASQFYWHSFAYARHFYQGLNSMVPFDHEFCGALLLAFNDSQAQRFEKMHEQAMWPHELARFVTRQQASELAKVTLPHDALYLPQGGWISPKSLVQSLLRHCQREAHFDYFPHHEISAYETKDKVTLRVNQPHHQHCPSYDALVLAGGADASALLPEFDLRLTRGQVEFLPSNNEFEHLSTLICHKGYFTPAYHGVHAAGSTYHKGDIGRDIRSSDTLHNIDTHQKAMADAHWTAFLAHAHQQSAASAQASVRCSTPDHLPLVGNLPNVAQQTQDYAKLGKGQKMQTLPENVKQVFVLSGLGSRGLTSAPLCAQLLANQIVGEALPLNSTLAQAINPNRFLLRQLKRSEG